MRKPVEFVDIDSIKRTRTTTPKYTGCSIPDCDKDHFSRGFCKKHWDRWHKWGDPNFVSRRPQGLSIVETLKWHMPEDPPLEGCWEWRGGKRNDGYGQITYQGKHLLAHHLAYRALVGPIPEGQILRHSCDNPSCVSPYHLIPGTQQDNIQDMLDRQRRPRGKQIGTKLDELDVLLLRATYDKGRFSQHDLARMFKIHVQTVRQVLSRETWKHVYAGMDLPE